MILTAHAIITYDFVSSFTILHSCLKKQRFGVFSLISITFYLEATNEVAEPVPTMEMVTAGAAGPTVEDRVTMKLDVAHTEHSHLIGKGGHCVKAMMLETQCHIHFPDSNRAPNVVEKSNQVSISGQSEDVERARRRIRVSRSGVLFYHLNQLLRIKISPNPTKIHFLYRNVDIGFDFNQF